MVDLQYTELSPEERKNILREKIKAVEIDHYVTSLSHKELEGTDVLADKEKLSVIRQNLALEIEHSRIRLRNLQEVLSES